MGSVYSAEYTRHILHFLQMVLSASAGTSNSGRGPTLCIWIEENLNSRVLIDLGIRA